MLTSVFSVVNTVELESQTVPIIDRDIFFGNPEITGGQISPDGKWLTFIKPYKDVGNIWIKGVNEDFTKARPITADSKRPIPAYFWSRDSKYLLFVQDKGGNENYHVYALDPFSKVLGEEGVPPARNITDFEGVRAMITLLPKSDHNIIYVGMNDRDPAWHDLYKVNIATGSRDLIYENVDRISGFDFDHNDKIRLSTRVKNDGSTELLRYVNGVFAPFYDCSFEESCTVRAFHKDNERVYLVTNKGDIDKTQLVLFNPDTGKEEFVESDPQKQADFGGLYMSDISKEIILTTYTADKTRVYFKNAEFEEDYIWLEKELPGAEINFGSHTTDERIYLVYANSDTDPGAAYLFDRDKKTLTFQYRPRPELPTEHLCKMTPVSYLSSDGLRIPAYLTVPKGMEAKNLPVVMLIHGGPWARDRWGYDSYAQFLANRGYVVLQPNFRSSTGFGKHFLNAGNGEWGELMQDDITYGVRYLVEKGIADENKVAIMGGSYGGYATLAGVTFTPDLYAAGVSIVGPSNLITLLGSIPAYWEAGRVIMYKRMANPETKEGRAQLIKQSPLNSATKIKTPLMVVQGANDPRVKQAESDQIVIAMREANLPVTYIVADDEGHGFRRPVNQMAFIAETEKFLAEHLGGRYQKGMKDDVKKRLEEITVDISKVELPKELSVEELNMALPEIVIKPTNSHLRYSFKIYMAGQEMIMDVQTQTTVSEDKVFINTTIESPMMNLKEELSLNKELNPISKKIKQGPVDMQLDYTAEKVTGYVNMQGEKKEINCILSDKIWDNNLGLELALCSIELNESLNSIVRVFDEQKNIVRKKRISIEGVDIVETPAGNFECFKVIVDDVEDSSPQTIYISTSKKDRVVVRKEAILKEMGGAKTIMELVKKY